MGNAKRVVLWIKDYFFNNARPDTKAVIGISGGKDSSICAALCVEALGKERVLGVLMPQDKQKDIDDSIRLCEHLGIDYITINIGDAVYDLKKRVIENMAPSGRADMEINLPARILCKRRLVNLQNKRKENPVMLKKHHSHSGRSVNDVS